jgi:Integral peroxisomal membrane peroxin
VNLTTCYCSHTSSRSPNNGSLLLGWPLLVRTSATDSPSFHDQTPTSLTLERILDTPWLSSMSKSDDASSTPHSTYDPSPPTIAAFSPNTLSGSSAASKQRSTIIVHKKSPLLVATPPQVTRALAYSHPFILPLNRLVGLLSWSTNDPWESFLLVAGFWGIALYGSYILRYAGPLIVVTVLILGMYSRRYSPLSSTFQAGDQHEKGHNREPSESSARHHKSLDEIVETLREFTTRCNVLLDPFLRLTDFLSTQRTPTSATTRPALTTLFIRILLVTPIWIALTLPPLYILTTRRVILTLGTIVLTWHSRPARVSRVILWRSLLIRRTCSVITGLSFSTPAKLSETTTSTSLLRPTLQPRRKSQTNLAAEIATKATARKRRPDSSGVRFTFILYENQRRWIGLGWTTTLFAYERDAWTDEHLNPAPSKDEFDLPDVEGGMARWRWVDGSTWKIERGDHQHQRSVSSADGKSTAVQKDLNDDGGGWIYYDNTWKDGAREDGWGRYTRRRKWWRDAELVEATGSTEVTPSPTDVEDGDGDGEGTPQKPRAASVEVKTSVSGSATPVTSGLDGQDLAKGDDETISVKKKKGWFSGGKEKHKEKERRERSGSKSSSGYKTGRTQLSGMSDRSRDGPEEDHLDRWRDRERSIASGGTGGFGVGEDVFLGLS